MVTLRLPPEGALDLLRRGIALHAQGRVGILQRRGQGSASGRPVPGAAHDSAAGRYSTAPRPKVHATASRAVRVAGGTRRK